MAELKQVVLPDLTTLETWKKQNYPFIYIVSVSAPSMDIGYTVSYRYRTPTITITYIEFSRP